MKEFLLDSALPFVGVTFAIAVLTLALFSVPPRLPAPLRATLPALSAEARSPVPARTRPQVDDTLARMLQTLRAARRPSGSIGPTSAATASSDIAATGSITRGTPGPALPMPAPSPDPQLMGAVSALGDAIKAVRDARTEEDFVHAEQEMRAAREKMESACSSTGGPLCDSAREIRSLGY